MKKAMFGIGTALTVGALLAVAGCSTQVMKDEGYIPLKDGNPAPLPAAQSDLAVGGPAAAPVEATEVAPAPAEAAPAPAEAAAPKTFPRFDESSITPVKSPRRAAAKHQVAAVKPGATYVVKSGDTLSHIAAAHRVRVADLKQINALKDDRIRVGQKLTIPEGGKAVAPAAAKADKAAAKSADKKDAAPELAEGGVYVIKAGDNIPKIAKRFGVKESDLKKANNLTDEATRRLQIGQKLVIPGKGAATAATAAAAPAPAAPAAAPAPAAPAASSEVPATTAAAADSVINDLPETPAPAAPVAVETPAPESPAAPSVIAPASEAAPAAEELETTVPDYIAKGTRLGDYLQQKKISLETFKKYNPSALSNFSREGDNELDAVAAENEVMVFIPGK